MQSIIERVTDGEDLTTEEAHNAVTAVFEEATEAQIGALLAALRAKGETEEEIAGFAAGMRNAARSIAPKRSPLIDIVGTGGDPYDTINVSTTSAIVTAAAGIPVAKHGNYSVSSSSGSADVLAECGVSIDAEPDIVEKQIETHGIGFLLAPVFHPAMKAVIGPRQELGMRTIFNVLGPLTNPAGVDAQVIGVFDPDLVPVLARAISALGVDRALVVHGAGLDECALHGPSTVAEVTEGHIEQFEITPDAVGLQSAPLETIAGGTPQDNAEDLRGIVNGTITGPKRDIILLNAGAAIYIADEVASIEDGITRAEAAIDSGAAAETLTALQETGSQ